MLLLLVCAEQLLLALYNDADNENVKDITVEDPAIAF